MRNREKNVGVGRWSISVIALGEELLLGEWMFYGQDVAIKIFKLKILWLRCCGEGEFEHVVWS